MSVTVNISGWFWYDKPRKAHVLKVQGSTVGECLSRVVEKKPELKPELFAADGSLVQVVDIYVNRAPILLNRFEKPVKDSDEIRVVPGGG